jgi:hypothetical protein
MTEEQTEQLISVLKDIGEALEGINAELSNFIQLFEECTYLLSRDDDAVVARVIRIARIDP